MPAPKDPKKYDEWCKKISLGNIGRIPWNKGRFGVSVETSQKMSNSWSYEKHVTSTSREKNQKAAIKQFADPHQRKKHSDILKLTHKLHPELGVAVSKRLYGKHPLKSTKQKISLSHMGIKHTEKTIQLLRELAIKQFQDPKKRELARQNRLLAKVNYKPSKPERMMKIALTLQGIQFSTQKPLIGRPDIFIEPNICIFVDGDYIHANPDIYGPNTIMKKGKLASEIWAYDIKINHKLNELGYQVIRIWAHKISKDANECAENIIKLIHQFGKEINSNNLIKGNLIRGD